MSEKEINVIDCHRADILFIIRNELGDIFGKVVVEVFGCIFLHRLLILGVQCVNFEQSQIVSNMHEFSSEKADVVGLDGVAELFAKFTLNRVPRASFAARELMDCQLLSHFRFVGSRSDGAEFV